MLFATSKIGQLSQFGTSIYTTDDTAIDNYFADGKVSSYLSIIGFIKNKSHSWKNTLRDLNNVKVISTINTNINTNINAKTVKTYPIWENDTTTISIKIGNLVFNDILYGIIFKSDI